MDIKKKFDQAPVFTTPVSRGSYMVDGKLVSVAELCALAYGYDKSLFKHKRRLASGEYMKIMKTHEASQVLVDHGHRVSSPADEN